MSEPISWHYPKDYRQSMLRQINTKPFVCRYDLKFWINGLNGQRYLTVFEQDTKKEIKNYILKEVK